MHLSMFMIHHILSSKKKASKELSEDEGDRENELKKCVYDLKRDFIMMVSSTKWFIGI